MDISNSLYQYHMCFIHETTIVEDNGINNAMIYQFGSQSIYLTNRVLEIK